MPTVAHEWAMAPVVGALKVDAQGDQHSWLRENKQQ